MAHRREAQQRLVTVITSEREGGGSVSVFAEREREVGSAGFFF